MNSIRWSHILAGAEIFFLASLPAWMQSPTGTAFLHSHMGIADLIGAAYVGFRAVGLIIKQTPQQPEAPAEAKE